MKRKLYTLGLLTIGMLLAMTPLSTMAEDFTPNIFPGQSADRTDLEISATVAVGEFGQATNTKSWVTELTSTNQDVVQTYNQNGYTAVLIVGVGTADVTYTETMFSTDAGGGGSSGGEGGTTVMGDKTSHTIHYTVVKGTPQAQYTMEREPVTEARAQWYGDGRYAFNPPSLEIITKEVYLEQGVFPMFRDKYISSRQCVITSSNTAVATASARGVTPVGLGETTITATWSGDDNWEGATASYELSVEIPKTSVFIYFPQSQISGTVGDVISAPTPTITPTGVTIDRWTSSDPEVATVDEKTGQVTMLKHGTTTISAFVDEDETYYAAQGYFMLTVNKPKPGLSFDVTDVEVEIGVPWTRPTLLNPNNVDLNKCKWYTDDVEKTVAEITEDGQQITINGPGTVTIYCEYESTESDYYAADAVSFNLEVTTIGLKVMGVNVTSLNCDDILGDGLKKVTYDKASSTLTLNEWYQDAQGANYEVSNGIILNESENQLNINLLGGNAIVNARRCIVSEKGPVVIMSSSKKDSLGLLASVIAIQTTAMKVYDSKLYATANDIAIKAIEELSVYKGGYVYALTNSESLPAIDTKSFIRGRDDSGGIEILTKGVIFNTSKGAPVGFFSDEDCKVPAKMIEIGKVPVTPASNDETVIEFTNSDPDDNDYVVFSTSANDSFNEETGQLEITTSLTDEQIESALETLVPGSSAWIDLLPGALTFDIPAGTGEIMVKCMTLEGHTLKVKVDGEVAISITQESTGWAKVSYNVTVPTHVVVYLHASSETKSRGMRRTQETPIVGAYIEAIKITPSEVVTGIDIIQAGKPVNGKYLKDGQLIIVRDGKSYSVTGIEQ